MSLSDVVKIVSSGVFHLVLLDNRDKRLASGTAFRSYDYLITNYHNLTGPIDARMWIRREGQNDPSKGLVLSMADLRQRVKSASSETQFDFAILEVPELFDSDKISYDFKMVEPKNHRIGQEISFLGYPLEHMNLTCHRGIISSFYDSGPTSIIQLDASVNPSNSGGPLFDPVTGKVLGIITRKATGLTNMFSQLRQSIDQNINLLTNIRGMIQMGAVDLGAALVNSQNQIKVTLNEIERQANVGIGYAFSVKHLLDDNIIYNKITES